MQPAGRRVCVRCERTLAGAGFLLCDECRAQLDTVPDSEVAPFVAGADKP